MDDSNQRLGLRSDYEEGGNHHDFKGKESSDYR